MRKEDLLKNINEKLDYLCDFIKNLGLDCKQPICDLLKDYQSSISCNKIPDSILIKIESSFNSLNIDDPYVKQGEIEKDDSIKYIKNLNEKARKAYVEFKLLRTIDFSDSNAVIIGANGSGKSTFAERLKNYLAEMRHGVVIPAQQLLIVPHFINTRNLKDIRDKYNRLQSQSFNDKISYNAEKDDDYAYSLVKQYNQDMQFVLSYLIAEHIHSNMCLAGKAKRDEEISVQDKISLLDTTIKIWNYLLPGKVLLFDEEDGNLKISSGHDIYDASRMSDGERDMLYTIGKVLLAPKNGIIIADEPEKHLHKAIVSKLWDKLEKERIDCQFIYLTHDIDFATSRNANKFWMKEYHLKPFEDWMISPVENNEIPESIYLTILGSKKKLLFCEGNKDSLDKKVFEIIYPDYSIIPVESCSNVISYTKAFNKVNDKYAEAIGIIDRDFRTKEEIQALKNNKVFTYDVAEVENIFLNEKFLQGFATYKHEKSIDINKIKEDIIHELDERKEEQASKYVAAYINYVLSITSITSANNKEKLENEFQNFINKIDIKQIYDKRISYLEEIIAKKDYDTVLKVFNNKGLRKIPEKLFGMNKYFTRAIDYLKSDDCDKENIKALFSIELNTNEVI